MAAGTRTRSTSARMGIRGFVSYSKKNRATAERIAEALSTLGVRPFVAHRDIVASQDWEQRLRSELNKCDVFVPLVTKSYWESEWAPQELGAAATRAKPCLVVAILLGGHRPRGFLKRVQGLHTTSKGIDPALFLAPLAEDYASVVLPKAVYWVRQADGPRELVHRLAPLAPYFSRLEAAHARRLGKTLAAKGGAQRPGKLRDLFGGFLRACERSLDADTKERVRRAMGSR